MSNYIFLKEWELDILVLILEKVEFLRVLSGLNRIYYIKFEKNGFLRVFWSLNLQKA